MGASLNGAALRHLRRRQHFQHVLFHHISTMEGGCCVTNDRKSTIWRARFAITAGRAICPADSTLGTRHDDPFFEAYRFVVPGYNVGRSNGRRRRTGAAQEAGPDARGPPRQRRPVRRRCSGATLGLSFSARTAPALVQLHHHSNPGSGLDRAKVMAEPARAESNSV